MSTTAWQPKLAMSMTDGWVRVRRWCADTSGSAMEVPHEEEVELWMLTACSIRCGHTEAGALE